jgi:hypothetical protein
VSVCLLFSGQQASQAGKHFRGWAWGRQYGSQIRIFAVTLEVRSHHSENIIGMPGNLGQSEKRLKVSASQRPRRGAEHMPRLDPKGSQPGENRRIVLVDDRLSFRHDSILSSRAARAITTEDREPQRLTRAASGRRAAGTAATPGKIIVPRTRPAATVTSFVTVGPIRNRCPSGRQSLRKAGRAEFFGENGPSATIPQTVTNVAKDATSNGGQGTNPPTSDRA